MVEKLAGVDFARLARGSTFWPAFLVLPRARRDDLAVLYGVLAYADDLVDDLPPAEAAPRLEALRKAVASCFEHPTPPDGLEALAGLCRRLSIPWELWEDFFEGLFQDTQASRYATYADLEAYCYRVASVVGLMSIKVFGLDTPEARSYAVALGRALQLTNILRDIPRDAERGRIYLPKEDLERFGAAEADLLEGRRTQEVEALLAFQGARAREAFAEASRLKPARSGRALVPAEIMRCLYRRLLDKMERNGYDVWSRRVALSGPERLIAVGRCLLAGLAGR